MSQINATLGHQVAEVAIAQFVGYLRQQAENDD
jgi:GGDEF domain-containing protein